MKSIIVTLSLSLFICVHAFPGVSPGGYIPEGCHLNLLSKSHVSQDDEIWMNCTRNGNSAPSDDLSDDYGWDAYVGFMSKVPITVMTSKWIVPKAPKKADGQLIFLFNGIEDGPHGDAGTQIIQPVLQFGVSNCGGGSYYSLASWYVDTDYSKSACSELIRVNEGDEILGRMTQYENGTWDVTGEATDSKTRKKTSTTLYITPQAPKEFWPNLVLEVYNQSGCDDLPGSGNTTFTQNTIETRSGVVDPKWEKYVLYSDCNQRIDINDKGDVTLIYG